MLVVAALVAFSTPTFEELSKQSLDPFETAKTGTLEYHFRFEAEGEPKAIGVTLRLSKGAKGSVFEGMRDGHKILRVMNDGKTMSVQATGAGVQCRVPADKMQPIDMAMIRIRPEGKSMKVTFLGDTSGDAFKGYTWKNTFDKADVMDGVNVRRLGYAGTKEGAPDVSVECWVDKKTSAFRFLRYKFGEGSISMSSKFNASPLPLPAGPLSKVAFKGYESVPLSLVREKVTALWLAGSEEKEDE